MAIRFLIGRGYVLVRYSFQDIQYYNVFKMKVIVNSNGQSVLNRNPNEDVMVRNYILMMLQQNVLHKKYVVQSFYL